MEIREMIIAMRPWFFLFLCVLAFTVVNAFLATWIFQTENIYLAAFAIAFYLAELITALIFGTERY